MSNNKQSSVEWYANQLDNLQYNPLEKNGYVNAKNRLLEQAKAMQQEQAHLYAAFVLKCVQNNLPPITFNDWINLDNNEQQ